MGIPLNKVQFLMEHIPVEAIVSGIKIFAVVFLISTEYMRFSAYQCLMQKTENLPSSVFCIRLEQPTSQGQITPSINRPSG